MSEHKIGEMYGISQRPNTFGGYLGNARIKKILAEAVDNNNLANGYIFFGESGTGKTTLSRIFASYALCSNRSEGEPCGKCSSCKSILTQMHSDYLEIDATNNGRREDIEMLLEKIETRISGRLFVYIDEAHRLSSNAKDALLKVLEMPGISERAVFIFSTTESFSMPDALVGRCPSYEVIKPNPKLLVDKLTSICNSEKIQFEEGCLETIAMYSNGRYRDAENALWSLVCESGKNLSLEFVKDSLGVYYTEVCDMVANIRNNMSLAIDSMMTLLDKAGPRKISSLIVRTLVDAVKTSSLSDFNTGFFHKDAVELFNNLGGTAGLLLEDIVSKSRFANPRNMESDLIALAYKYKRGDFVPTNEIVPLNPPKPYVSGSIPKEKSEDRSEPSQKLGGVYDMIANQREAKAAARAASGTDVKKENPISYLENSAGETVLRVRRS